MMLTLTEGSFRSGGREALIERIRERVAAGEPCILLVPEQQTAIAEAEMASLLPPSAPLIFEVTNFTRLANTVFRAVGGLAGKSAGKGERALIMWRTLSELLPSLSFSSQSRTNAVTQGAIDKMLAAVSEMRALSVKPSDLAELQAEDRFRDDRLKAKLADLSLVMNTFDRLLTEKFTDADSDLERMCEKLRKNRDLFADSAVFVEGFTSFTEPQYRVLSVLMTRCPVEVFLAIPKAGRKAFVYSEPVECERRLLALADKNGVEKKTGKTDGFVGVRSELLAEVCDLLWSSGTEKIIFDNNSLQNKDAIRIFEAENPYEEASFLASDIQARVMNDGARYSDFAVVCRHADAYAGILDEALVESGIPIFFSRRSEISSFEPMRLFSAAYRAVSSGFSRRDVIDFAKCPLSGIPADEVDEFEIYAETWQISGRRFTDAEPWNMNPAGYTERKSAGTAKKLVRVEATRRAILAPLVTLADSSKGLIPVRSHAEALVRLMLDLSLSERIEARAEELSVLGETDRARDTALLYPAICDALDRLVDTVGECKVDAETFYSLLEILFSELKVGHIPSYRDAVTVGSADQIRLFGKKHIYLFGCNDGEFPETVGDGTYFSEHEKATLSEIGFPLAPDRNVRSARELFIFSRAFSFASDSVTLLYPLRDAAFELKAPSEAIAKILSLTEGKIRAVKISSLPMLDVTYRPDYAIEHLAENPNERTAMRRVLEAEGYADRLRVSEGELQNKRLIVGREMASALYGKTVALTPSKLDTYYECPMRYFCQEDLKLGKDEVARFNAGNEGSFIHAVLEYFFREMRDRKAAGKTALADLTEREKEEIIERAADRYLDSVAEGAERQSARLSLLSARLRRSALPIVNSLCEEFSNCSYLPVFFECKLGGNGENPRPAAFKTDDGRDILIYGKVDRVDSASVPGKTYLRVIDYKTGKKDFSPEQLKKGENLQMFLYLKALTETDTPEFRSAIGAKPEDRILPAGVIYVKAELDDITADHKKEVAESERSLGRGRLGMLLDDGEAIPLMNPDFLPVKFKNDGTPYANSQSKLYTEEGWNDLMKSVNASVCGTVKALASGTVEATPLIRKKNSVCENCPYKAFCRKAKV